MAVPAVAIDGLNITDAESGTFANWGKLGLISNPVQETDIYLQGSAAVSSRASNKDGTLYYDYGSGLDFTTTYAGYHVAIWFQCTTLASLDTVANGGIAIFLGTSTANYDEWYVLGDDTREIYNGGWIRLIIDPTKTPTNTGGTGLSLSSVQYFGITINTDGTAKAENLIIDRIDIINGLVVTAGDATTPGSWQEVFDLDDASANKYGVIEKRGETFFVQGRITIGDAAGSATTYWLDQSGASVEFTNPVYWNGAAFVSSVSSDLFGLDFVGNATGTTDISFGQVVGTGDDRQGISGGRIATAGPKFTLDAETDIADLDTVNLYGVTLVGAGITKFSGSTKTDIIGCTFSQCDEVQPNDSEFLNNVVIEPVPDRGMEMLSTHNIKQVSFIAGADVGFPALYVWQVDESTTPDTFVDVTDSFNGVSGVDTDTPFPSAEAANDFCAFGSRRKFGKVVIDLATLGTGSPAVTWEYWDGTTWTALTGVTDGTSAFTSDGNVIYDIPTDWAALDLNDTEALYWVRARLTATFTTDPTFDGTSGTGTLDEGIEHHVYFPSAGTYGFDALEFFGHAPDGAPKWHAGSDAGYTVIDEYLSADATRNMPQAYDGQSQSFTGDGNDIGFALFQLTRVGSPTGTVVAKVYAHSGTFGTSSIPTGSALATSDTIDVSTLSTSAEDVLFTFPTPYTTVASTKYCIAIEFTGTGDISNNVLVAIRASGAAHGGNWAGLAASTWSPVSTRDMYFAVYTDAVAAIIINASNGANPTEAECDIADVTVNNPQTIEITGVTEGARVSIVRLDTGVELLNDLAFTADGTGAFKGSTSFNYAGADVDVRVSAGSSGKVVAGVAVDSAVFTDETVQANDSRTGAGNTMTLLPVTSPAAGDGFYFGHTEQFFQMDLDVLTAGAGTYTLDWEYWDGTAWSALTVTDNTNDYKNSGINRVSWTDPGDWDTTSVTNQPGPSDLYYVRAVKTGAGTVTTTPVGRAVQLDVTKYQRWEDQNTITSTGLSARAAWLVDETATF